jgi:tyrosine-protein kinase
LFTNKTCIFSFIIKGNYIPPETRIKTSEFLHDSSVNRETAKQILDNYKTEQGVYLVRKTQRDENILVLSLMWNSEFFNYEICIKDLPQYATPHSNNNKYYFIDDGPYFKSLLSLIEHYKKYEDGLPGLLTKPISPLSISFSSIPNSQSTTFNHLNNNVIDATRQSKANQSKQTNSMQKLISNNIDPINIQSNTLANISNHPLMQFNSTTNSSVSTSSSNDFGPKSNALTKASLFKSRTLLNDQSNNF